MIPPWLAAATVALLALTFGGDGSIKHCFSRKDVSVVGFAMAFSPSSFPRNYSSKNGEQSKKHGHYHNRDIFFEPTSHSLKPRRVRHTRSILHASSSSSTTHLDVINGDNNSIEDKTTNQDIEDNDNIDIPPTSMMKSDKQDTILTTAAAEEFDSIVNARYACTRFQRYQEQSTKHGENNNNTTTAAATTPTASISNPTTVQKAHECLALSQRAPTGFNAQPYRIILVHSKFDKEKLAQYCLGRNADRVRDSDCTAVFLADRECGRDGKRFEEFLTQNMDNTDTTDTNVSKKKFKAKTSGGGRTRRPLSSRALLKLRLLIMLFSSGYPLPRLLSVPFSFGIRLGVSILSFFTRCLHSMKQRFSIFKRILPNNMQLLPTLSTSETWSEKNTMLVAMTYMLACTSRGLVTCPMEGFDARGVKDVLGIRPRGRYGIPLIVSTGVPLHRNTNVKDEEEEEETDDVGLSHGSTDNMSPRYPLEEVVYGNTFGQPFMA